MRCFCFKNRGHVANIEIALAMDINVERVKYLLKLATHELHKLLEQQL